MSEFSLFDKLASYSLLDLGRLAYSLLLTRIFYNRARLVRQPFYLKGSRYISWGYGFTTGYGCRIEAIPCEAGDRKSTRLNSSH